MPLRKDAKVEMIGKVPLFAACSRSELGKVARLADEVDLRAGRALTREGEPGREFFVLLEGSAEVRRAGRKIRELGPGDFFGEIALVSNIPRTATVRTTAPTRALVIVNRDFRSLLEQSPKVQLKVLQALAERLAATTL
jgi:CRP-like cAMP-binding protein